MHDQFYAGRLRTAMQAPFPTPEQRLASFYAMLEYHLGWRDEQLQPSQADSGKLIRARLCLLGCRAVGGTEQQALPLAAAIQLLHDFSLVHDDIQDRSELRRGRPTVWRLWGDAQAINVGDGLFSIAHLALLQLQEAGVAADRTLDIMRRFESTILRICEGQYLDLAFEERLDLQEADYLAMIERKTAALIAASVSLGALAGGASAAAAAALADYGAALGMAFQIEDDLLGIWGDPAVTGKPFAADLYRRKKSLPVVYALAHAAADDQALLRSIYRQEQIAEAEVAALLGVLERAAARSATQDAAARYHGLALAALEQVSGGQQQVLDELRELANSLLGRSR